MTNHSIDRHATAWCFRPVLSIFASTLLLLAAGTVAAATGAGNAALLAGAESFENITESTPTLDQKGFDKLYAGYAAHAAKIDTALDAGQRKALHANVEGLQRRWHRGERWAVALDAIESYRILVSAVDRSAMPGPVQVSLLDYSGFRLNALAIGGNGPRWPAVARTTAEAGGFWKAIRPQVKDPMLREAMDRTIQAMDVAAQTKQADLLAYSADMDLVLVDGLEQYFASVKPAH